MYLKLLRSIEVERKKRDSRSLEKLEFRVFNGVGRETCTAVWPYEKDNGEGI
jgi:hypothetical protein